VLKRSLSSALLVRAAGVPRRIGFATEGRGMLLTDRVVYRPDQHEVENFLDCLRAIDAPIRSRALELWPTPENDAKVKARFARAGWKTEDLKIIIHPGQPPGKAMAARSFASVMRVLRDRYKARFVYTGAKGDVALYREIEKHGPFNGLDLCGVTNLRENISVYRAANLFFGVDSGPMHMAAATGLPVVALFGPTDERKWGPWGQGHTVITKRFPYPANHNALTMSVKRITVEEAPRLLNRRSGPLSRSSCGINMTQKLSVAIITYNEETNIRRTLESVKWADEIVVVDSGSTDKTVAICREYTDKVIRQDWPGFARQKNAAIERTSGDWVLSLDADEPIESALAEDPGIISRSVDDIAYRVRPSFSGNRSDTAVGIRTTISACSARAEDGSKNGLCMR
jgi:ADP-heptose:LPS heptosyltransferase